MDETETVTARHTQHTHTHRERERETPSEFYLNKLPISPRTCPGTASNHVAVRGVLIGVTVHRSYGHSALYCGTGGCVLLHGCLFAMSVF